MDTRQNRPVGELWGLPPARAVGSPAMSAPGRAPDVGAGGIVDTADDAPTRPLGLPVSRTPEAPAARRTRAWPTSTLVAAGLATVMLVAAVVVGGVILSRAPTGEPVGAQGPVVAQHPAAMAPGVTPAAVVPRAESGPEPVVTTTSCPEEAARTVAEPTEAVSVGHSRTVHIAVCRGTSGQLYYFGANDRTGLTITLPALPTSGGWTTTNNGVTYVITRSALRISRGATLLDRQALTSGW